MCLGDRDDVAKKLLRFFVAQLPKQPMTLAISPYCLLVICAALSASCCPGAGKRSPVWRGDASCSDDAWIPTEIMGDLRHEEKNVAVIRYPGTYGAVVRCRRGERDCWELALTDVKRTEIALRSFARTSPALRDAGACLFPRRLRGVNRGETRAIFVELFEFPVRDWLFAELPWSHESIWLYVFPNGAVVPWSALAN